MGRPVRTGSPGARLQLGASVLAAARTVDTHLVKSRLSRFEQVHRNYVTAQRKLDAVETQLRNAQIRVAEHDAAQDEAVLALAGALVADGQPLRNAFEAFGAPAPGSLTRLPFAEEAEAVHKLAAAVHRSRGISKATIQAAQAADKAARQVEQALVPVAKLQDSVREARRMRDAVGQGWESALAALRRGTRAAADEGAPELDATLFQPVARAATKSKPAAEPAPAASETETTTPNAA